VLVHQDAQVFVSKLNPGVSATHALGGGRGVYFYVIHGDVKINGDRMTTGDASRIWDEPTVAIEAEDVSELIFVDVGLG
jgi:quercetin 2,3-dioxygenase